MKNYQILLIFLFYLSHFKSFAQTKSVELNCTECHVAIINQPFIHVAAADDCANCHLGNGNEHPKDNVIGFSLTTEMPQLCFSCHENFNKSNIHAPAGEGECLICHSPHASANKSLLLNNQPHLCSQCHNIGLENKKYKHYPVFDGNCQTCHDPHQSDFVHFLKKEKLSLCINCHDNIKTETGYTNIHPPFTDDCANCHNTHGSDNKALLSQSIPDLCYSCHTKLQTSIKNSKIIHKAISESKGCSNCHSPHASNQSKILILGEKELCLNCHNKNIQTEKETLQDISKMLKKGNFVHGVIERDGCVVCHDPHNSDFPRLLVKNYPIGQYTNGESENFALCFSCHDSGLMDNKEDSEATNFRNGNQNLHFVHLKGEKGRNCNMCHNVHGSVFDYLISNKIKFGNWEMPLNFIKNDNGGTCNTGCHEDKKYFR